MTTFGKLFVGGIVILAVVLLGFWYKGSQKVDEGVVMCTMEAKMCPDGSYVGRQGPLCEFAACPNLPYATSTMMSTTTSGVSFKYPGALTTKYVSLANWPPVMRLRATPFSCVVGTTTREVALGDRQYCVTTTSEGAAGSLYTSYMYLFTQETKTVEMAFSLRTPQCANYDAEARVACTEEQEKFNEDALAHAIASTVTLASTTSCGANCKDDLIVVDTPKVGATVSSPITVTGKARGNWYFEATFPVTVVDWDGKIVGEGYAQAQGDWMTTNYVPFKGTITYDTKAIAAAPYKRGWIIYKKDNPSGEPQFDNALELEITFK